MNITLKNLKVAEHLSEETLAFTATVYVDEKRIGTAKNDGHGGCNFYYWTDRIAGDALEAYAATLDDFEPLDGLIADLIDRELSRKWYKRHCKNKTLFRVNGDDEGSWRTINRPFGPQVQAFLAQKYPNQISEIANMTRV